MTVAYDLRYATDHFTGIGTHAYCLLEALLEAPGPERYAVLWDPRLPHRRYDVPALLGHPRATPVEARVRPLHPLEPLALGSLLRRLRPDVYLSPFYFRPVAARCPVALTIHDVFPLRLPEGLSAPRLAIYRASLALARGADAVLTSSDFSRGEIVELVRVAAGRVHTVRLGVPPARHAAEPARPAGVPDGPFALVVGDNRPRKNLATLARAWARLGPAPPLALVAAGPALDRYPSLPALAGREGAAGVHGLGWVGEGELEWLYRNAAMVLFPSLYEGFGFPLVEAYARGLPTVAAAIPTLREIGEGATSFVPPEDDAAWAAEVRRIAESPAARATLAAAARARAGELTYARTAAATLGVLRAIARPLPPARALA